MSIWLGGLVLLAFGLPAGRFWDTAVRFSPWGLGAVAALALSGIANGWRQLGSISGLTDSTYGRWLVIKVLIVFVVVGVAAFSRRSTRADDDSRSSTVRRSVIVEVAGIALVLMATAGLVNSPPPPSSAQNASASAVVGDRIAQVELEPAVTGGTEMHVYVTSPGGGLDRADEITVTAALPSADLGPLDLDVVIRRTEPCDRHRRHPAGRRALDLRGDGALRRVRPGRLHGRDPGRRLMSPRSTIEGCHSVLIQ